MTYLPDINVWLAFVSPRHIHHAVARDWLQGIDRDSISFCRITQMGFLRLLTNKKVMGIDVISQSKAWETYDAIQKDSRVTFLNEPSGLEEIWRAMTQHRTPATRVWTDAYLAAFAKARELTLISLDKAMQSVKEISVIVLKE